MFGMLVLVSLEPQLEPGWPVSYKGVWFVAPGVWQNRGLYLWSERLDYSPKFYVWLLNGEEYADWLIWRITDKGLVYGKMFPSWDLDGDGTTEVFILKDNVWGIYRLETNVFLPIKEHWDNCFYMYSSPVLFDIDSDGSPEVFWYEGFDINASEVLKEVRIYRFDGYKTDSAVFMLNTYKISDKPVVNAFSVRLPIGDFDNDGSTELAIMLPAEDTTYPTKLSVVDARTFKVKREVKVRGGIWQYPIVGDLDGDHSSEAIFATWIYHREPGGQDSACIYVIDLASGDIEGLRTFPEPITATGINPITLGDVDGDGLPEIVLFWLDRLSDSSEDYVLQFEVYDTRLNLLEDTSITLEHYWNVSVSLLDVDEDRKDDFVVPVPLLYYDEWSVSAFSFSSGPIWQVHIPPDTNLGNSFVPLGGNLSTPLVWDLDDDAYPEIVAARGYWDTSSTYGISFLSLFEIPVQNPHLGWPMLYHDPWNTNNYDFWPPQTGVRESSGKTQGSLTLKPTLKGLLVRSPKPQKLPLRVYDPAGRLLYKAELTLKPGENLVEIPGKGVRLVMVGKAKAKVVGR